MKPAAVIEHCLPGRVRLRVAARKGDRRWLEEIRDSLSALEGVRSVRVTPLTGGIVIEHGTDSLDDLLGRIAERELFELGATQERYGHRPPSEDRTDAGGRPGPRPEALDLDPRRLAGLALLALAVRQVLRGHILGPATSLAFSALELLLPDSDRA